MMHRRAPELSGRSHPMRRSPHGLFKILRQTAGVRNAKGLQRIFGVDQDEGNAAQLDAVINPGVVQLDRIG
jgi:hypothetical protein